MDDTLLSEKTTAFSIAQEILSTDLNIPTLPANGKKILELIRQPKDRIDVPRFVKLVESDPGLFTRILKLANSPFYSEVDKIVSLRAAITRIGLTEIVNTVCLYFFQKLLPKFPDIPGFSYNGFWAHSWAVAIANRRLGHPHLEMGVLPGELYMAGMLQGMGKLLLAIHYPRHFADCVKQAKNHGQPLDTIERKIFATSDSLIASKVLTSWEMPPNICQAIAYCRRPELAPPEHMIIAGLTQFAYAVVEQSGVGSSGDGSKINISDTCFGKNPKLKIAQPRIQTPLVKEIRHLIQTKAEKIAAMGDSNRSEPRSNRYTEDNGGGLERDEKPERTGVLNWVKSLWK